MKPPSTILIPWRQRWHDARLQLLPVLVFGTAVCVLGILWKDYVAAPTLVGQAEPVLANIASHKPGILAGLAIDRFQKVKAGDVIGQVLIADPKLLESSLAVIQAEIEMVRISLNPIAQQQRNAVDYGQLRLDWLKQRVALATARVNAQLAEAEWRRSDLLFREQIISDSLRDQARAAYDGYRQEVEELTKLVDEGEQSFKAMQPAGSHDLNQVTEEPVRAAIAVQEARLRQVEAELLPVALRVPMDGIITAIYHRSGESVTPGQPIVAIAALSPARIIGYLRPPLENELRSGMRVQVRTRGLKRRSGEARIVEVGTQFEAIPAVLTVPSRFAGVELGLPVDISLPPNLNILPGELVDINIVRQDR